MASGGAIGASSFRERPTARPEIAGSAAFDRAEYSLQQGSIVIALVVGGLALFAVGALRLRRAGFAAMPRPLALFAIVAGVAVVMFAILLQIIGPSAEDVPSAMATLEPIADEPSRPPKGDSEGVRGTVVDSAGDPVSGVEVVLYPLFDEKDVDAVEDVTDADGGFSFDDVEVDPGSPWIAEARFDGARFPSGVLRAPRDEQDALKLVVEQTTRKPSDIEVKAESLAIVGDETGAQAVHALTVRNDGDRAFVGGLRLPLLRTATAIQEGAGLDRRYLSLEEGEMVSSAPVLPGSHDLTYTYVVQMQKDGVAVDHRVRSPTQRYELLVGEGLRVQRARELRDDGTVTLGPREASRTYRRYVAHDLEPGARLQATIGIARPMSILRVLLAIGAVLVVLGFVLIPLVRRRRPGERTEPEPQHTSTPA